MNIVVDIIKCLLSGFCVGVYGFISALPIYNQLSEIKEHLIAVLIGIPVGFVSAMFSIYSIGKIINKVGKNL